MMSNGFLTGPKGGPGWHCLLRTAISSSVPAIFDQSSIHSIQGYGRRNSVFSCRIRRQSSRTGGQAEQEGKQGCRQQAGLVVDSQTSGMHVRRRLSIPKLVMSRSVAGCGNWPTGSAMRKTSSSRSERETRPRITSCRMVTDMPYMNKLELIVA